MRGRCRTRRRSTARKRRTGFETPDRPSNSNGAAPKIFGVDDPAKTRDRNSSVSDIDLDGSIKRTLDAVSSKLDGISGKAAESSKRFSVVDLKKKFESNPRANDELAETSGYHSDSTQNVDVKTLRSTFEKAEQRHHLDHQAKQTLKRREAQGDGESS